MSRTLTLLTLLALMSMPFSVAYPDGIGESADSGCLCHGAADELTVVKILGLPETYESSTQYNLSLVIESDVERDAESVENWGGFRLIVSSGEILGAPQQYEEGYTHTNASEVSWNVTWVSPEDDSKTTRFRLHVNAVNGNNEQTGDNWNSFEQRIPGINYQGEVSENTESTSNGNRQMLTGIIGISALLLVGFWATRD